MNHTVVALLCVLWQRIKPHAKRTCASTDIRHHLYQAYPWPIKLSGGGVCPLPPPLSEAAVAVLVLRRGHILHNRLVHCNPQLLADRVAT